MGLRKEKEIIISWLVFNSVKAELSLDFSCNSKLSGSSIHLKEANITGKWEAICLRKETNMLSLLSLADLVSFL